MTHYVTLNGARFLGYRNSDVRKGYRDIRDAVRAASELQRGYPWSGDRKNTWATETVN